MSPLRLLVLAAALPCLAACASHSPRPATSAVPRECRSGYELQVINPLNVEHDVVTWDRPGGVSKVIGSVSPGETRTFTLPPASRGQFMLQPSFDALHPVHYDPATTARPGSVRTRVTCL